MRTPLRFISVLRHTHLPALTLVCVAFLLLCPVSGVYAQLDQLQRTISPESPLSMRWELDSATRRASFLITPYKPVYVLPLTWTSHPNEKPISENPDYSVEQSIPLSATEMKFQISFKTKIWSGIFGGFGDLWAAYTQSSRWQVYNAELSRAFRETNYEPEAILSLPVRYKLLGFQGRWVGLSFNHQSNGRAVPLSRSWNRIILQAAWEKPHWMIWARGWFRIKDEEDENPLITEYTGSGDVLVTYAAKGHEVSMQGRHSLHTGSKSHGSIQFDWAVPIKGNLKMHAQCFHGYGESMIDYNHKQTILSIGISLIEWQ